MVYVTQSAGRILRAIFEICLKRGWAGLTHKALALCQMVEKRMWGSMTPLRQFPGVPKDIVRRLEGKQFAWYRYFDLEPAGSFFFLGRVAEPPADSSFAFAALAELIGSNDPKAGRLVHRLVHEFPKRTLPSPPLFRAARADSSPETLVELQATVFPITRSMLKIELTITPDFIWNEKVHGAVESFWILVEDVDGEIILFHDQFLLRQRYAVPRNDVAQDSFVSFTVPMLDPLPPNYFITVLSDRWLHSETRLPISFKHRAFLSPPPPLVCLLSRLFSE